MLEGSKALSLVLTKLCQGGTGCRIKWGKRMCLPVPILDALGIVNILDLLGGHGGSTIAPVEEIRVNYVDSFIFPWIQATDGPCSSCCKSGSL